jgi:hypothetical protein
MLLELDHGFFSHYIETGFSQTKSGGNRRIFHEDIQNRDILLVTIGDSWTWGDSIDGINPYEKLDSPKRLTSIYGYHLQQLIGNCDWVNLAYPGTANMWIKDVALRFIDIQQQVNYKKIILSVGLTDYGRDTKYAYTPTGQTYQQLAESIEHTHLTELHQLDGHPVIKLIVGRNFTSTFSSNKKVIDHLIPERWIDISGKNWNTNYLIPDCWTIVLPDNLNTTEKHWAIDVMMPAADQITQFLIDCPLHYKRATKHPTEECHQLWSKHVYQYILDSNILAES